MRKPTSASPSARRRIRGRRLFALLPVAALLSLPLQACSAAETGSGAANRTDTRQERGASDHVDARERARFGIHLVSATPVVLRLDTHLGSLASAVPFSRETLPLASAGNDGSTDERVADRTLVPVALQWR